MKMEQIECSETSAYNNQTPGKYPKEYIQNVMTITTLLISNNRRDFDKSRVSNITVCDSKLFQEKCLLAGCSFHYNVQYEAYQHFNEAFLELTAAPGSLIHLQLPAARQFLRSVSVIPSDYVPYNIIRH